VLVDEALWPATGGFCPLSVKFWQITEASRVNDDCRSVAEPVLFVAARVAEAAALDTAELAATPALDEDLPAPLPMFPPLWLRGRGAAAAEATRAKKKMEAVFI